MNTRVFFQRASHKPEPGHVCLRRMSLMLCFISLLIPAQLYAASIANIQESIITLRSDTISTVPGNSQRKLLKNLNNALGALENADTMLRIGKRKAGSKYIIRAGEYMDNYLRRLDKLVGRGDILPAAAETLGAGAQNVLQQLRE